MKKIVVLFLILAMALGAAGCGSSAPADEAPPAPAPAPAAPAGEGGGSLEAEITVWSMPFGTATESFLTDQLIAGFNQDYPGVKVNLEMLSWDGGPEKLQIALGTGTTPDIYMDGTARNATLPSKDVLADVSDLIGKHSGRFFPGYMEIGKLNGSNYLVPIGGMFATALTVNATLAKELGTHDMLPQDRKSWTWDDFYDFCKATSDAGKAQGVSGLSLFAGSQSSDISMYSMMLCNGGELLSADRTESLANSAACVEVLDLMGRLVTEGIAAPGASTLRDEDCEPLFFSQKVVMNMDGATSYYINTFAAFKEDGTIDEIPELEVYMYPTPDGGKSGQRTGSWGCNSMAIFKNDGDAAKIEAAIAFADYYLSRDDLQVAFCQDASNLPVFQGVDVPQTNDNMIANMPYMLEFAGNYADSSFGLLEPYWIECRSFFYPEVQAVYTGTKSAQDALDAYKANVDGILAAQ